VGVEFIIMGARVNCEAVAGDCCVCGGLLCVGKCGWEI
jgi:hypothetical protein